MYKLSKSKFQQQLKFKMGNIIKKLFKFIHQVQEVWQKFRMELTIMLLLIQYNYILLIPVKL